MRFSYNPYIQSPDEKSILDRIGTLTNITYRDKDQACHTIALTAYRLLLEKHHSIIVVENNESKEMLWRHMADMNIQDMAHECNVNDALTNAEWQSIKDALHVENQKVSDPIRDAEFRFEIADSKIKKYYSRNAEENGFDLSRILEKYLQLGNDDALTIMQVKLHSSDLTFDLKTYQKLLKDITELAPNYQPAFELMDNGPYAESLRKSSALLDNLSDAVYVLFTFREESNILRNKFLQKSISIKNAYTKEKYRVISEVDEIVQLIGHKLSLLRTKIGNTNKSKGLFNIFSKTDDNIDTIKNQINVDIQWIKEIFNNHRCNVESVNVNDLLNVENYKNWLNRINLNIKTIESRIPKLTAEYIKSINKLNFLDEDLEALEAELQSLIIRLNNANTLGIQLENNTLSLVKQTDVLDHIIQLIDKRTLGIDSNIPYYQWLTLIADLDQPTLSILDVLRQFDKRYWVEHFNRWFYYNVLYRHTHRHHHINSLDLANSFDWHLSVYEQSANMLKGCDQSNAKKLLKNLKKTQPEIYRKLMSDKSDDTLIYWRQLLQNASELVSCVFPVLILDSDDIANDMEGNYQAVFYMDTVSANPDTLQTYKTVHTYIAGNQQDKIATDLRLDGFFIRNPKPISDIHVADRAKSALKIASLMANFKVVPRIFQLRKTSMIYYGQGFIADKLAADLYHHGVKEVDINDGITAALSAAWLIAESAPIVITENYLLDHHDVESYLWQISLLSNIQEHGGTVINLDINNMWSDGINALVSDILKAIKRENPNKHELKNQMIFEF